MTETAPRTRTIGEDSLPGPRCEKKSKERDGSADFWAGACAEGWAGDWTCGWAAAGEAETCGEAAGLCAAGDAAWIAGCCGWAGFAETGAAATGGFGLAAAGAVLEDSNASVIWLRDQPTLESWDRICSSEAPFARLRSIKSTSFWSVKRNHRCLERKAAGNKRFFEGKTGSF